MNSKIKVILLIVHVFFSFECFAQEEFFFNHSGLSVSDSKQLNSDVNSLGISYLSKHGLFFSGAYTASDKYESLTESLGYLFYNHTDEGKGNTKGLLALSYTHSLREDNRFINMHLGVIHVFLPKTNFPFSISGSSYYSKHLGYSSSYGYYTGYSSNYDFGFSIAYTQTFFAKNRIYPVIGITKSFQVTNGKTQSLFLNVGFNIKM
jgi:hypothetical protein